MSAPRTSPLPATPGDLVPGRPHVYEAPAQLRLNYWALPGDWTAGGEAATADTAGGQIACRFHARDLNMVLSPQTPGTGVRFLVLLDGQPPGDHHGTDADGQGMGAVAEPRLYQLIRQHRPVAERTFQITFTDPGVQANAFTFG